MERMGAKRPAPSVVHKEFKAEIVGRCQPGDHSVGQVAGTLI